MIAKLLVVNTVESLVFSAGPPAAVLVLTQAASVLVRAPPSWAPEATPAGTAHLGPAFMTL